MLYYFVEKHIVDVVWFDHSQLKISLDFMLIFNLLFIFRSFTDMRSYNKLISLFHANL